VVAPGVGLDDHSLLPPQKVHLVGTEARVHLRLRKTVAAAEAEEETFEFAPRELLLPLEISRADQVQVQGTADSPLVHGLGNGAVEVLEGPSRSGRHAPEAFPRARQRFDG